MQPESLGMQQLDWQCEGCSDQTGCAGSLSVTHNSVGTLNLSWTPAARLDGNGYEVHYTASATVSNDADAVFNPSQGWAEASGWSAHNRIITGLTKVGVYRVRVRAVNNFGQYSAWTYAQGTLTSVPRVPPPRGDWKVRNVAITTTPDKMEVTWDAPKVVADNPDFFSGDGAGLISYEMRIRATGPVAGSSVTTCRQGEFWILGGNDGTKREERVVGHIRTSHRNGNSRTFWLGSSGYGYPKYGCSYNVRMRAMYQGFPYPSSPLAGSPRRSDFSGYSPVSIVQQRQLTVKVNGVSRADGSTVPVDEGSRVTITLDLSEPAPERGLRFQLVASGTATGELIPYIIHDPHGDAFGCRANKGHRDWQGHFGCHGNRPIKSLHVPAGKTSVSTTIDILQDFTPEPGAPETIVLRIGGGSSGRYETANSNQAVTLAIGDVLVRHSLRARSTGLSTGREPDPEGAYPVGASLGPIEFQVTLTPPSEQTVTVDYHTEDGLGELNGWGTPATAGSDYTATTGTLTFAPGETLKRVYVPIIDDTHEDTNEVFRLVLSNPQGATLVIAQVIGLILNHEKDTSPEPEIVEVEPESDQTEEQQLGPPTAAFERMPTEHDGGEAFAIDLRFSEALGDVGVAPSADSFRVQAGSVAGVERVSAGLWRVRVQPKNWKDVTVTLALPSLSNTPSASITGPVRIRIEGARAKEGKDKTLDFPVTLNRAVSHAVSVAYATADDTATAGADYTATSGTLTFAAGETAKTVNVPVLDDVVDEGKETMRLTLSNPQGAYLRHVHRQARGVIKNDDPLQRAWLSRFGRTAATHVTDAVGDRLRGGSGPASHLTIGGYRLPLGQKAAGTPAPGSEPAAKERTLAAQLWGPLPDAEAAPPGRLAALVTDVARGLGMGPGGATPDAPGHDPRLGQAPALHLPDLRQVLLGSAFRLNLGATDADAPAPRLTAWGRFAGTTFDGREDTLALDGDVFTGTVGVDGEWDRLLAGVAVAHSRGTGGFTRPGLADRGTGDLEQTLTSLHPYLRYAVTDRLDVWGLVGYGWGELDLELANDVTVETDTTLVMGAFGGRGILLAPADTGGVQLATRTDAMLTRTSSDAVANSAATDADAHRLRVILEGSRAVTWADGRSLTPTLELGVRHDWGDAETGFGLELGGRVQYADPALGLTIEGAVRGLLAHEDDDYQEWGASGTVRLAPGPAGQGLALTVAPTWGATASGVDGLWARQTTQGLAPQGTQATPAGQLAADVGYGFAAFDTGLLTPYAGTVLSAGADRTYRLGARWASVTGLALTLEGRRLEPAGPQPVNQGLRLQATWGF